MFENIMPMSWNEPGGKKSDPFRKKNDDGPPDLDQIFGNFQEKLRKFFGFGGGSGNGSAGAGGGALGTFVIILVAVVIYGVSGFYIVKPAEQAVVTRFGKYSRTLGSGPHWFPRFIEKQETRNTEKIYSTRHVGTMLTKDENLVTLEIEVQYQISDINNFLFKIDDPEKSLRQASESALRQVVGMNKLDYIITEGRGEIEEQTDKQLVIILNSYNSGLKLEAVNLKEAKAPSQVKAAFDDATKAREDRERYIHEAEAYYNKVVPEAKGNAQQMLEEAAAYKQEAINKAKGDTERFNLALPEFKKAPKITKTRLYLDALEQVLSRSSKVMVDLDSGNNLVYLPLDRLLSKNGEKTESQLPETQEVLGKLSSAKESETNMRERDRSMRERDRRRRSS